MEGGRERENKEERRETNGKKKKREEEKLKFISPMHMVNPPHFVNFVKKIFLRFPVSVICASFCTLSPNTTSQLLLIHQYLLHALLYYPGKAPALMLPFPPVIPDTQIPDLTRAHSNRSRSGFHFRRQVQGF
jgi:hypothetical protein